MAEIPQWHVAGDWFDVAAATSPVRAYSDNRRQPMFAVLAYRVREEHFSDVALANLNLVLATTFQDNIWAGQATGFKAALFVDNVANTQQQEALQTIFSGQAGVIPA